MKLITKILVLCSVCSTVVLATPRARDLGIPFIGRPGAQNAITDVPGVLVGQVSLVQDFAGNKKIRTGVTAILPRGKDSIQNPVYGASFALNGNGEMTGTAWLDESGFLEGPIMLTNTHSVGVVRDAVIQWRVAQDSADSSGYWWSLPVVAETWDGHLNDINGFHVKTEHAISALTQASAGPVAEGNTGGGTGMVCHEFKCGTGTASRQIRFGQQTYHIGVLVQANYGLRDYLTIAGVPVGQHLRNDRVYSEDNPAAGDTGSIIIVIATDAPLLPHQLKRIAKRAGMGLAKMGSYAGNGSGDIFIAFSTANQNASQGGSVSRVEQWPNESIDPLFLATVQATEEAIVNALVAGRDTEGHQGRYAKGINHAALKAVMKKYNRLNP